MTTIITIKARRIASLLKALVAIDGLHLKNSTLILEIAQTIDSVRNVYDELELAQGEIVAEVVDSANAPQIQTQANQVRLNPDSIIKKRLTDLGNTTRTIVARRIPAPELFAGEVKPTPAQVAELLCLLTDVDKVENATDETPA